MLTVAWGWVRDTDGTIRDISGLVFPARIEPILATPMSRESLLRDRATKELENSPFGQFVKATKNGPLGIVPSRGGGSFLMGPTIYNADNGGPYGYIDPAEFDDPSSLDDYTTVAGAGKKLETLQYGFRVNDEVPSFVFVNWEMFSTFNSSIQPPLSAFGGSFVDFAVLMLASDIPGVGNWKLTIDVQEANAVLPTNTIYVSQQFWQDNEVNFETRLRNIYNTGAAPSVGSSQNQFWFDYDPLNNIFTNGEVDILSGEGTFSNHLRTLTALDGGGGVTDTIRPLTYTVVQGRNPIGVVNNLWTSNDVYVTVQPTVFAQTGVPPLQVAVEGFAEDETALTMKFKAETASFNGSSTQRILLWNYTTNGYDLVDTRAAPGTDGVTEITVSGNPSRYIHPTDLNVKALLQYTPGVFSSSNWTVRFDQTIWTITR